MNSIKVLASNSYLPNNKINNDYFNKKFKLDENWIEKRTGIKTRFFADEKIELMAYNSCKNIVKNLEDVNEIDLIIVATTSTNNLMPGISHYIQKKLNIDECICLDILAGCGGCPNAFDIAAKYIELGEARKALVIGVEKLSDYINDDDINTSILFGDGAGCILIGKEDENKDKLYKSKIRNISKNSDILTCDNINKKIYMDGTAIYKFAVTETVRIIKEILEENKLNIDDIKYIIPHQSNQRILDSISKRLNIPQEKVYTNLSNVGNTFCASIPIAFSEIFNQNKINKNDKIILLGYGGGLNISCILLEI